MMSPPASTPPSTKPSGDALSRSNSVDWPTLIRRSPDPSAPDAPSPLIYSLITYIAYSIYLCSLPVYASYVVLIHYLTPRPFGSWTLRRRLTTRLAKLQVYLVAWWIPPPPQEWDDWSVSPFPGRLYLEAKERGEIGIEVVKIRAVEQGYIRGFADVSRVQAEDRPGFWISPKGSVGNGNGLAKQGERVILHIHGGSYIRGHPLWTPFPMDIALLTNYRCMSINYRKTLSPETAFPAPLLDALAAYVHLTQTLQFHPSDIIVLAESAGAHLALMLSQYLEELSRDISESGGTTLQNTAHKIEMKSLGQPGYLVLSSPWADFTLSQPSYDTNAAFDQLVPLRLRRAVKSATRHHDPRMRATRLFSPCAAHPEDWQYLTPIQRSNQRRRTNPKTEVDTGARRSGTKVYIHYGGKELFRDEIVQLLTRMQEAGVDVRMREDSEGLHTSGMIATTEAGRVFRKDLLEMLDA